MLLSFSIDTYVDSDSERQTWAATMQKCEARNNVTFNWSK